MQILVAEDERTTRVMLVRTLEKLGYGVVSAQDGTQAWKILSGPDAPKIALLDWMMPGLTGVELCQRIRAQENKAYTYVILLTGKTSDVDVVTGLEAGADDYLKKPLKNEELKARVRSGVRVVEQDFALRRLLLEHATVLQAIPSALIVTNRSDCIVELNGRAEVLLGASSKSLVGTKLTALHAKWDWPTLLEHIAYCWDVRETVSISSMKMTGPEGRDLLLDVTVTPLILEGGALPSVLLILTDVTDRRQLQDDLFRAQKLESVGQLAAGVAHEINSPSQFVRNNLEFLNGSFQRVIPFLDRGLAQSQGLDLDVLKTDISDAILEAVDGIDRITKIVRSINDYVHPDSPVMEPVDIHALIEGSCAITRNQWKHAAKIVYNFDESIPQVLAHRSEIQQVLINLIVNAAHAIEDTSDGSDPGTITISTSRSSEYVTITVQDTGLGIPEENVNRIFDPFFTTKEVGKGTGQGLALSHKIIVENHQGKISVESVEGCGACFTFSLPLEESDGVRS